MCIDPGTLAVISLATTAASTAYAGYTEVKRNEYQAGVADNNAIYAGRQARDAQAAGEQELEAHYRKVAQVRAAQQEGFASAGVDTSFGTPAEVMADTTIGGNADAGRIASNAISQENGFLIGKQNALADAGAARAAASSAVLGTGLKLAGTLVSGASNVSSTFGKYGAPKWTGAWGQKVAKAYGYR